MVRRIRGSHPFLGVRPIRRGWNRILVEVYTSVWPTTYLSHFNTNSGSHWPDWIRPHVGRIRVKSNRIICAVRIQLFQAGIPQRVKRRLHGRILYLRACGQITSDGALFWILLQKSLFIFPWLTESRADRLYFIQRSLVQIPLWKTIFLCSTVP